MTNTIPHWNLFQTLSCQIRISWPVHISPEMECMLYCSLCAIHTTCPGKLLYTWSSTPRNRRIQHGNKLAQAAGPNTMELSVMQQMPAHFLADWQTMMQFGIRSIQSIIQSSINFLMVSSCLTTFLFLALTLPPPDNCFKVTLAVPCSFWITSVNSKRWGCAFCENVHLYNHVDLK